MVVPTAASVGLPALYPPSQPMSLLLGKRIPPVTVTPALVVSNFVESLCLN